MRKKQLSLPQIQDFPKEEQERIQNAQIKAKFERNLLTKEEMKEMFTKQTKIENFLEYKKSLKANLSVIREVDETEANDELPEFAIKTRDLYKSIYDIDLDSLSKIKRKSMTEPSVSSPQKKKKQKRARTESKLI